MSNKITVTKPKQYELLNEEELNYDGGESKVPWWGWAIICTTAVGALCTGLYFKFKPSNVAFDTSIPDNVMDNVNIHESSISGIDSGRVNAAGGIDEVSKMYGPHLGKKGGYNLFLSHPGLPK